MEPASDIGGDSVPHRTTFWAPVAPASGGGAKDDESAVLDGAPGGSEGSGESDGVGSPASLGCVPCRPRRMALRLSSSWGRSRRCTSYSRRSFSALSCSIRTSSRLFSSTLST
eukprot:scaffold16490_cov73-Phaeocystis_antarctica.AAC.6